jgi:hypothetical protein
MVLDGKGFYVWKIRSVENGDPSAIANAAYKAGLSHVLLKIADGIYPFNIDTNTRIDLVPPVVTALHAKGIAVWGWHYVYGYDPASEARVAIQRVKELGLDGYVINAEGEYETAGKPAAQRLMNDLRSQLPTFPIALSSYRFPSYHPQLAWQVFLEGCDFNMPQVYWEKAHNPAAQLRRCLQEFQAMTPYRPIIPTGSAYENQGWWPTDQEVLEFLETARASQLSAANFFSWDECCRKFGSLWNTIAAYSWPGTPSTPQAKTVERFLGAFNAGKTEDLASLYTPEAVHVNAQRTLVGSSAIASWYKDLLSKTLPQGNFSLVALNIASESSLSFTWTARSTSGVVRDGCDTLGFVDGKISYHYTFFTVSPA